MTTATIFRFRPTRGWDSGAPSAASAPAARSACGEDCTSVTMSCPVKVRVALAWVFAAAASLAETGSNRSWMSPTVTTSPAFKTASWTG